jgi:hypothetical protein
MTQAVLTVRLRSMDAHPKQRAFVESKAKRIYARVGRRGGKTTGLAMKAVERFLAGGRVLYATPTDDQIDRFWYEVKAALAEPIAARVFYKNETEHVIELPGTLQRIRAKTAYNADTLRGDYADLLICDEYQLMNEDTWELVGAPMMLDTNGDAVFAFTPPSLRTKTVSRARDPLHAVKQMRQAATDESGRTAIFHWTSLDNPHLSRAGLADVTKDMTSVAYRQEILAEDLETVPGALWTPQMIQYREPPHAKDKDGQDLGRDLVACVVGVDPAGGGGSEIGIVVGAKARDGKAYVLDDRSVDGSVSPDTWARRAIAAYHDHKAGWIAAEKNFGGAMVKHTIMTVDPNVPVREVNATRGKAVRAEPVSALYEQGRALHVRPFPELEMQMCQWVPGPNSKSPDRLDGMVWALASLNVSVPTDLMKQVVFV